MEALRLCLSTYFWGLTPADLKRFSLAAVSAFATLFLIPWLNRRWDERVLLVATMAL